MSIKKTIIVLLACLFVVSLGLSTVAFADETATEPSAPSIYCNKGISVNKGNGFYVYVYAKDFAAVAGLDLFVYYDQNVFTLGSVSKGSMLDGSLSDINAENSGEVCMSMVSASGLNGQGTLLSMLFYAKSDVAEGKYTINVAVGDCYDVALNGVTVLTDNCSVNITKAPEITETVKFVAERSVAEAQKGDSFEVVFRTDYSRGFATANFEIEYDHTLLKLESAAFGAEMKSAEGAVYSVNTDVTGYVGASYAALSDVPSYLSQVFVVRFTVIADEDMQTAVSFKASGLYNSQLIAFNGSTCQTSVQLHKLPTVVVNPKVCVESVATTERSFAVRIVAEAGSKIAAGDFYVGFDGAKLVCTSIKSVADGCMVVGNPKFDDGVARFSFIAEDGIKSDSVLAELTFSATADCGETLSLHLQGKQLYDSAYAAVEVDFVDGTVRLLHKFADDFTVDKHATCTENGSKSKHCTYCDEKDEVTTIGALGHDLVHHEGKTATCTENGWNEYDTCRRCDHTTYSEIAAKGHTEVVDNAVAPTCTETGLTEGKHCSVCGEVLVAQKVVSALNHDIGKWQQTKAPSCTEAGEERRYCSRCDHFETRELAALGHTRGNAVEENRVEATCTTDGHYDSVVYCTACNEELSRTQETLQKLGHDLVHHEGKAATCTEKGWNEYDTCSRCDHTTYSEVAAKGHTKGNVVQEKRIEATCTTDGHYDSVVYCAVCHKELSREQKTIARLGHNAVWVTDKEPTCIEKGSKHSECSVCHEWLSVADIPVCDHKYSEWTIVVNPTTETEGRMTHKCEVCGAIEEKSISKVETIGCFGAVSASGGAVAVTLIVVAAVVARKKRKAN